MGIVVTNGLDGAIIVDVTPKPFPWRAVAIATVMMLAVAAAVIWFVLVGHHSKGSPSGGGGGAGGAAGAAAAAAVNARRQVKQMTLAPERIELVRKSAKGSKAIPVADIKDAAAKKLWRGGLVKLRLKTGETEAILADDDLFALLICEFQKRYRFPVICTKSVLARI